MINNLVKSTNRIDVKLKDEVLHKILLLFVLFN